MYRTTRIDGCCGVTELWGFVPYDKVTIPYVLNGNMAGIAIATTVEGQYWADDQLREHGFHKVLRTWNPKTDNTITLWVRDLSTGKRPKRLDKRRNIFMRACYLLRYLFKSAVRARNNSSGRGSHVSNKNLSPLE